MKKTYDDSFEDNSHRMKTIILIPTKIANKQAINARAYPIFPILTPK